MLVRGAQKAIDLLLSHHEITRRGRRACDWALPMMVPKTISWAMSVVVISMMVPETHSRAVSVVGTSMVSLSHLSRALAWSTGVSFPVKGVLEIVQAAFERLDLGIVQEHGRKIDGFVRRDERNDSFGRLVREVMPDVADGDCKESEEDHDGHR